MHGVLRDTGRMDFNYQRMGDRQDESATQTVEVHVERLAGERLHPADFARRLVALCSAMGIDAALDETGTAVEFEPGLEGADDELTNGLGKLLQARFHV